MTCRHLEKYFCKFKILKARGENSIFMSIFVPRFYEFSDLIWSQGPRSQATNSKSNLCLVSKDEFNDTKSYNSENKVLVSKDLVPRPFDQVCNNRH